MPAQSSQALAAQKFRFDKSTSGNVTMLALHGVLDAGFEGKKFADSVRTKKLIVNLRNVRRFASWGMSEWMTFMREVTDRDLYIVECSAYAVNQMTLVTGLLGSGKLVSFYAPFRCASCGEEFEALMIVPTDRDVIRDIADSSRPCVACGRGARMDKYPASMFAQIAERPHFDIDDEVLHFMRARFKYDIAPDLTRFRAHRKVEGGFTYIRVSGSLATLPAENLARACQGTTVIHLASAVFHPEELQNWRNFVPIASANVTSLQLLDCPSGFLETAVRVEDLHAKLRVRTFAVDYYCPTCNTTSPHSIDVAQNLEQLAEGILPTARCLTCRQQLPPPSHELVNHVRALPARENDPALDKFLEKARTEPAEKLEDALQLAPPRPIKPRAPRVVYFASALSVIVAVAVVAIAARVWNKKEAPVEAPLGLGSEKGATPKGSAFTRPDWILIDEPAAAFCQETGINRLTCTGVSSYRTSQNDAVAEASDAALDELVNAIALKISTPQFKDNVLGDYSSTRGKALSAMQALDTDRRGAAYQTANEVVRKARRQVVEALQASGGAAVPSQRTDWYWEEYAIEKGSGTEFLVFARYDVTLDAIKTLVEKYSTVTSAGGNAALTAFPGLGWRYATFAGGAQLTAVNKAFATAGLAPKQVVTAIGDQHVVDATGFAHMLDEAMRKGGEVQVTVQTADATKVVTIRR